MGLDSVELLVETEKFFKISIPDNEAEEVFTVHDFANCVLNRVYIKENDKNIAKTIFYEIRQCLTQYHNISNEIISPNSIISQVLPAENRNDIWDNLENCLQLNLPKLTKNDLKADVLQKRVSFLGIKIEDIFSSKSILGESTFSNLVDWIISLNFRKLINPDEINSDYEIQRAIVGIITEKMGIDVQSIELKHRITYDLGID
jgi:acyl carrier protein